MNVRRFALIFGIVYLAAGIAGFIPPLLRAPAGDSPHVAVHAFEGYLFGLFHVNVLHSLVHVLIGIWGLIAYRSYNASVMYGRSLAVIYGLLTVMGLIPQLNTVFGLIPLHGNDVWLHAGTALIAAYFGFASRPEVRAETTTH